MANHRLHHVTMEVATNMLSSSGLEEPLEAESVSSFITLSFDYSYAWKNHLRFHGGLEIPFQDYSTAKTTGSVSGTLSGFTPYAGVSYALYPASELLEEKSYGIFIGGRVGFQSVTVSVEDTQTGGNGTFDLTGSGILIYPYINGYFKLNPLVSFYLQTGYRLSTISELEADTAANNASNISLSGLSLGGGISIHF